MSNLVAKIENILLEGFLDIICNVSVVYLTIEGNILGEYNSVEELANCAVNSALMKINDLDQRQKVFEILSQVND